MGTNFIEDELLKRSSDGILTPMHSGDIFAVPRSATFIVAASDSMHPQQSDFTCDGTDDQVEIQAAIDALPSDGGKVVLMEGTYVKGNTVGISVPSDCEIEITTGATVEFANGLNAEAQIFVNSDMDSGNVNIWIHGGGCLDGNRANNSSGEQSAIKFTKVSKSTVNVSMKNFRSYNVQEITPKGCCEIINREFPNLFTPQINVLNKLESHQLRQLIDDFETDWTEVTGTAIYDTDIKHSGTRSIKLVAVGSPGANGIARIEKAISPIIDESEMCHGLWVYAEDMSTLEQLTIYLRSGGSWTEYGKENFLYQVRDRKFANSKWIFMGTKRNAHTTPNFDPTAVDMIRLEVKSLTNTTSTVWLDKLVHAPKSITKNGMVTIVFDDGLISDYTKAKQIFDKYNFVACSAVTVDNIGTADYMDETQLKELQQSGWDIIPHSVTHACVKDGINVEDSYALIEEEVLGSQNWAMQHGFINGARFYVMPGGYYSAEYLDVIEKHFIAARGFAPYMNGESLPLFDPRILSCRSAGAGQGIDSIKSIIDEAFDEKRWLILVLHGVVDSGEPCDIVKLEAILEHVQNKNMPVVNFSSVFDDILFTPIQTIQCSDLYMDVLAVSSTHIRSNEDMSAVIPITFTLDTQPDVPRTLSWSFDSHAQITEYDMEVIGVDAKGNAITETWDEGDGWSGETNNAFATITSIKMISRTGTGAADTMDIGITDVLGLSNVIYETGDVFKIKKNTANATVAKAQVSPTYGTYDMGVITLGVGDDFTIWYKSNLNIIS